MLPTRTNLSKIVILRPGALGDVLAVRGVIRFFKVQFPDADITLAAPGDRGAFLCRAGWADRHVDWDRAAFAWLFSDGSGEPPPVLRAVFSGSNLILCYLDSGGDAERERFEERLRQLSPGAALVLCPSQPPAGHREPIGQWLLRAAFGFCQRFGLVKAGLELDQFELAGSRIRLEATEHRPWRPEQGYAVIHPGSGSAKKNWPRKNFAAVARVVQRETGMAIAVTAGEADGQLGESLAGDIGHCRLIQSPTLESLAGLLANARLFLGNDSGVSHLAAAVESSDGRAPVKAVIFGPSDPSVWAPPDSLVLAAGDGMDRLGPEQVWDRIVRYSADRVG